MPGGTFDLFGETQQSTFHRLIQYDSGSIELLDGRGDQIQLLNVTASYAISASHEIIKEVSSSYSDFATSASHAELSDNASTSSFADFTISASFAENTLTSSFAETAISASYSVTASYAENFDILGMQVFS